MLQIISFHKPLQEYNISNIPLGVEGGDKLIEILEDSYHLIQLECRSCGQYKFINIYNIDSLYILLTLHVDISEKQNVCIRILLERNNFYYKNPCMNKNYFTNEDTAIIDEWIKRIKYK